MDYILISKRFSTSVHLNKTRSFPGADICSDHDMVMMTFRIHLKSPMKNKFIRNKFNLGKLKDPEPAKLFKQKCYVFLQVHIFEKCRIEYFEKQNTYSYLPLHC